MDLYSLRIQGLRKHSDTTIYFSDSTFLIGENNVCMSVYGDLRIINGYIRITVPIKKGDKLVYIDLEDSPPVPQWSTSTHFSKPGEARSGSMNLTITQGATYIYVNDDYPVSIGMYNIDFVYTVT